MKLPALLLHTACLFSILQQVSSSSAEQGRELQESTCNSCRNPIAFDPSRHKSNYKVGVLNFRGPDSAYAQHNETFANYLTATAGQRFDPPISFEMIPVDFQTMFDVAAEGSVDFLYVSPSPFACLEAEYGAQSLVSHIAMRVVGGNTYELPNFAGVILARADNQDINEIRDLKDKIIGSAAISSFGGGQMQFRELQKIGLSYINDPKQLVFTGNQGAIVNGVLNGELDAGFVRTDQIERTVDADGNPVDPTLIKVLEPKENFIDGEPFPFTASTQLYPEWNLAAMEFVPADVSAEVQAAMLSLLEFSQSGKAVQECLEANLDDSQNCSISIVAPEARCDTTLEIAAIADRAMINGRYAGFRTTQSYIDIRAMLQDTNFIGKDEETGVWRCARPNELYEAIVCPPGHFKKSEEEVDSGCADSGLECKEGYQCVCNPCVKAFDVDVSPSTVGSGSGSGSGCPKMSLCGVTQQRKPLELRAVDNKKRDRGVMTVLVHEGESVNEVKVVRGSEPYTYDFSVASKFEGIVVLEIKIDGEQIPESPLRVQIEERDCSEDFAFDLHVAAEDGTCVCGPNTASFGDSCVPFSILFSAIFVPVAIAIGIAVYMYVKKKTRDADSVWYVKRSDLKFKSPPDVIGQGSFGLVLLGEYRGTKVAVKRALPPSAKSEGGSSSNHRTSGTVGSSIAAYMVRDETSPSEQVKANAEKRKDLDEALGSVLEVVEEGGPSTTDGSATEGDEELGASPKPKKIKSILKASPTEEGAVRKNSLLIGSGAGNDSSGTKPPGRMSSIQKGGHASIKTGHTSIKAGHASISGPPASASNKRWFSPFGSKHATADSKQDFIKEMRLLSKLRHPCITTVMGAVIEKGEEPLLVMEYMAHGSLYDIIHNESMFIDGEMMLHILRDISQGIRFLHGADPPVIHGDLKSCNILVDNKFRAKVSDFGLSRKANEGARGTPYWMAPELLRGETGNTTASDMYSLGIILFELYSRKDPYDDEDFEEVLRLVCDKRVNKRPRLPGTCPPKVAKLVKFLLVAEPGNRPSADVLDNRISEFEAPDVEPRQTNRKRQMRKGTSLRDQAGSTDVLYQVFPPHIADVLKNGGKVEPESHESVTIFFSDIVGFTEIASTFAPIMISNLLDRLYTGFDELARKYDLFKIETIGDAYMCAANLAKNQSSNHVKLVAEFSIEAVKMASSVLIDQDDPSQGHVQIRVGFHTGPVVSNVVGSLNPRYGVFGDTVNVSSRMESTSEAGRIHCSQQSAHLLMKQGPKIPLVSRGVTKIKGKGKMVTYWVS